MEGPRVTNAFTQKYIFPGGYVPAMSEVTQAIEDAGLWITDVEVLRLHYAETLKHWRQRFMADPEIPALYPEPFRARDLPVRLALYSLEYDLAALRDCYAGLWDAAAHRHVLDRVRAALDERVIL